MATDAENASLSISQTWARIAELDTVPLTERARMNYTDDNGRSFGWNDYRASLMATIEKLQGAGSGQSSLQQQAGGPFTFWA